MKERIDIVDQIKVKDFCSLNDTMKKVKIQITEQKKMLMTGTLHKGFGSRIHKVLTQLNNKNSNDPMKLDEGFEQRGHLVVWLLL